MRGIFSLVASFFLLIALIGIASAAQDVCNPDVVLLNQDPIHAVPGEYVKVVFQVKGIENPLCGNVQVNVQPEYPFSADPGVELSKTLPGGTYTKDYSSYASIPLRLRIDKEALDQDYELKVEYFEVGKPSRTTKTFNISVEDVKTDFDVFVKDYISSTSILTLNVLNIGKIDVEALTVSILKQQNVIVKGSSKEIIGTLDANQDSPVSFEAIPQKGDITVSISYNDANGLRRTVDKIVQFDPEYFTGRKADEKKTSWTAYFIGILVLVLVVWFVKRKFFKKKKHAN